jgi:hypothetical protein
MNHVIARPGLEYRQPVGRQDGFKPMGAEGARRDGKRPIDRGKSKP